MNFLAKKIASGEAPIAIGDLEPVNVQIALRQFDAYVTEAGLDFEEYKPMVLDWWQIPGGEVDQYTASKRKKRRGTQSVTKTCSAQAMQ